MGCWDGKETAPISDSSFHLLNSNVANSSFFNWRSVWPNLVAHFGAPPPQRVGPLMDKGGVFSVSKDMKDRSSHVWNEMCKKTRGLDPKAIDFATFDFMDFALAGNQMMILSMVKARKFGFCGVRDTDEMFMEIFARMRKAGALPPATQGKASL